jgi:flagellar basal-body rod protein FlgG
MLQGLYAAASGMEAQQTQLDAISNDVANSDTAGYQSTVVGFHDLLYGTDGQPTGAATVGSGAAADTIGYSQIEGSLNVTNNPLDVAILGPGYMEVRQPDGTVGLTRNGTLQISGEGQLTTSEGMPLQPPITLPKGTDASKVEISATGTVTVSGQKVGTIAIVNVPAPNQLVASGNSVLSPSAASGSIKPVTGSSFQQGALEQSNVDLNAEMTQMMQAEQTYDIASKAISFETQMGQIASTLK